MSNTVTKKNKKNKRITTAVVVGVGMLSAVSVVLQMLDFPIGFIMPSFVKFDFSDLPALIGAYAYGPVAGILIELIKNLIHCAVSKSATVGELSNFILGATFAGVAGLVYAHKKSKKTAVVGGISGAVAMAVISYPSNLFIVYPFYYSLMPKEAVLAAYQAIMPGVKSMEMALLVFNVPFTLVKGLACVLVSLFIYKPLSRFLKGNN